MSEESRRVLVVDDDPDVALFVKTVLERRAGCVVAVAGDGPSALSMLADFQPDVMVTDIQMPGISGIELLTAIRQDAPWMPVVVMTAHVSVDYAVSALRAQADEFLTKPLDSTRLVEVVARLADEGRARRDAAAPFGRSSAYSTWKRFIASRAAARNSRLPAACGLRICS